MHRNPRSSNNIAVPRDNLIFHWTNTTRSIVRAFRIPRGRAKGTDLFRPWNAWHYNESTVQRRDSIISFNYREQQARSHIRGDTRFAALFPGKSIAAIVSRFRALALGPILFSPRFSNYLGTNWKAVTRNIISKNQSFEFQTPFPVARVLSRVSGFSDIISNRAVLILIILVKNFSNVTFRFY